MDDNFSCIIPQAWVKLHSVPFLPRPQVELFKRFIAAVRVISKSIWVYADSKESPSNRPRGRLLRLSPLFNIIINI